MKKILISLLVLSLNSLADVPIQGTVEGVDQEGKYCNLEITPHSSIPDAYSVNAYFKSEITLGIHHFRTLLLAENEIQCGYLRKEKRNRISMRGNFSSELLRFQQINFNFAEKNHKTLESFSVKGSDGFTHLGACLRLKTKKSKTCYLKDTL